MFQIPKPYRIIIIGFAMVLLLPSCSIGKERESIRRQSEQEVRSEIYSAVLGHQFKDGTRSFTDYCAEQGGLTFSSATQIYAVKESDWPRAEKLIPDLQPETWESFFQMNAQPVPFPEDLELGCKYVLLDIKENPQERRENCTPINYFSQIGLNSRRDQALVYWANSCGDFSYGNLYFLKIVDGHWQVTDMEELYIT